MAGYKGLSEKTRKDIVSLLEQSQEYLDKDDLLGLYNNLSKITPKDASLNGLEYCGYIMEFLEDCGIDTTVTIFKTMIVPVNYYYSPSFEPDTPKSLLTNITLGGNDYTCLSFQGKVRDIAENAFFNHDDYEVIDLRGVSNVYSEAFALNSNLEGIIINASLPFFAPRAFRTNAIEHIWLDGVDFHTAYQQVARQLSNAGVNLDNTDWVELR